MRRLAAGLGRVEIIQLWFAGTIVLLILSAGRDIPGRFGWIAAHLAVVIPIVLFPFVRILVLRFGLSCCLVPVFFWSMGRYLPDLVPESFEQQVMEWNAAIGGEWVQSLFAEPPAWLVEVCVLCYSSFYFLPLTLAFVFIRAKNDVALRHLAELVIGGFLLSYLGYLCMPTLPPYRYLPYETELIGGFFHEYFYPLLYEYEALRQDCMPSGHTMITVLTVYLAWRHSKRHLLWLCPIAFFLILGTLVLRYHWFVDLLVAIPFVMLAIWLFPAPVSSASQSRGVGRASRR